jgi:2,4-dienoyl-CoA reductase-like NADH-dependent reductase (Old Yellow Enzyme family)
MVEATALLPAGRISPQDSGLWQDSSDSEQVCGLRSLVEFVHSQGCAVGVQLSHAGRKGSTVAPWLVPKEDTNGQNSQGQTQKQRRTRGSLKPPPPTTDGQTKSSRRQEAKR